MPGNSTPRAGSFAGCVIGATRIRTRPSACRAAGVHVGCFRPPSVPEGTSRLRAAVRADLTDADLTYAIDVIRRAIA